MEPVACGMGAHIFLDIMNTDRTRRGSFEETKLYTEGYINLTSQRSKK